MVTELPESTQPNEPPRTDDLATFDRGGDLPRQFQIPCARLLFRGDAAFRKKREQPFEHASPGEQVLLPGEDHLE